MDDKCHEALKKYPLKVYNIYRARGAYLIETDCGLKLFKCYEGSRNRALFEHTVKEHLYMHGYHNVDLYVKTIEDDIIAEDQSGCRYVLKNWFWGEECNLKDLLQVETASANLAKIHNILRGVNFTGEQVEYNTEGDLKETFEKRNRELKRVKGYIRDKRQKNEFEILFLNFYDEFYAQGVEAINKLAGSAYRDVMEESVKNRMVFHGNYNYHNIIMLKNKTETVSKNNVSPSISAADISPEWGRATAVTNFEKARIGLQISDLYQFIRKVMEKNDWDDLYGNNIIEAYDRIRPISRDELEILYILLLYPEKFWKITNFYYNGKKVWVSERNINKLNSIGEQNPKRIAFLRKLESIL